MMSQTASRVRSCSWMVWQVVKWTRPMPCFRIISAVNASFSGVTQPAGMRRRSMLALPSRCA